MNEIGRRVAAVRKERDLRIRDLAELTGLSEGQISRLENGRRNFRSETLIRIARALDVKPHQLFLSAETEEQYRPGSAGARLKAGKLREALRDPGFVSLLGEIAAAYRNSPAEFRAIESVIRTVLGETGREA